MTDLNNTNNTQTADGISGEHPAIEQLSAFGMDPRRLAVMGFNLTAIGFLLSNVHLEGFMPVYLPGAFLNPQVHHIAAALFLIAGSGVSLSVLRYGILFTPGLALLLSGSFFTHFFNLRL